MAATAILTGSPASAPSGAWRRRVLSIPALFLALPTLLALSPLLFAGALAFDGLRRVRHLGATRTVAFVLLYLSCESAGMLVAGGLWLARPFTGHERFLAHNFALQCWWARNLRRLAFGLFRMTVKVEGAEAATPGPIIAFVRHASLADTMLPVMLISDPHRIVLRWVMKQELLWDPCLDVVGHRLRNCFVTRMPDEGDRDIAAVASLAEDLGPNDGVVLYPEGTRFSAKKRARILARLRDKNDQAGLARAQELEAVLPPRLGGALALLEANPGADVVFMAHRGLEGAATVREMVDGGLVGAEVKVSLWRIPFAELPSRGERAAWLHAQWRRMDERVRR